MSEDCRLETKRYILRFQWRLGSRTCDSHAEDCCPKTVGLTTYPAYTFSYNLLIELICCLTNSLLPRWTRKDICTRTALCKSSVLCLETKPTQSRVDWDLRSQDVIVTDKNRQGWKMQDSENDRENHRGRKYKTAAEGFTTNTVKTKHVPIYLLEVSLNITQSSSIELWLFKILFWFNRSTLALKLSIFK